MSSDSESSTTNVSRSSVQQLSTSSDQTKKSVRFEDGTRPGDDESKIQGRRRMANKSARNMPSNEAIVEPDVYSADPILPEHPFHSKPASSAGDVSRSSASSVSHGPLMTHEVPVFYVQSSSDTPQQPSRLNSIFQIPPRQPLSFPNGFQSMQWAKRMEKEDKQRARENILEQAISDTLVPPTPTRTRVRLTPRIARRVLTELSQPVWLKMGRPEMPLQPSPLAPFPVDENITAGFISVNAMAGKSLLNSDKRIPRQPDPSITTTRPAFLLPDTAILQQNSPYCNMPRFVPLSEPQARPSQRPFGHIPFEQRTYASTRPLKQSTQQHRRETERISTEEYIWSSDESGTDDRLSETWMTL